MKPLSTRARQMLAAYRRDQALPPELRAQTLRAVRQRLHAGDAGAEPAAGAGPAPGGTLARRLVAHAFSGRLALLGLVSGVALWAALSPPRPIAVRPSAGPAAQAVPQISERGPARSTPPARREPAVAGAEQAPPRVPAPVRLTAPSAASSSVRRRPARSPAAQRDHARDPAAARPAEAARDALVASASAPSAANVGPIEPPAGRAPEAAVEARAAQVRLPAALPKMREGLPPPRSLDVEVMQLREAYDRLRAGQPLRALNALSEHARRFPGSKLGEMRDVARMLALCDLGKQRLAREQAATFLRGHADSPYAARVRRICEESPAALPKID
jgi:hypothetical protein